MEGVAAIMSWLRRRAPTIALGVILIAVTVTAEMTHRQPSKPRASKSEAVTPVPVQTAEAKLRRLPRTVEVSGQVEPLVRAEVAPEIMGRILEMGPREGDQVSEGTVLARIDDSAAQAEVARANAMVAAARAAKSQAEAAFKIQQTQSEVRVSQAQQDLAMAQSSREEEKAQADEAVRQAESAVAAAQALVDLVKEGARKQEKAQAQERVRQAQAGLEQARAALDKARNGPRPQEVKEAEHAVAQAQSAVDQAEAALSKAREGARRQERAEADQSVILAEAQYTTAEAAHRRMKALMDAEVISKQAFEESELKLQAAKSALEVARQRTNLVHEGARTQDIQSAEAAVSQAKAAHSAALERLKLLQEGTRPEDVRMAEQQVAAAESAVEQARQHAEMLLEGPRSQEVIQAEEALRQAEAQAEIARKARDMVHAGARPEKVKQAEDAVRMAEASTEENTIRQQAVEAAQAALAQAEAAAQAANVTLAHTQVRCPYTGIVVERLADAGDMAVPGQPIVVIQPNDRFQLRCDVPEAEAKLLQTNQRIDVVIDAIGAKPLSATVVTVTPSTDASSRSSVVKLALPADPRLRSGQFGRARIPIGQRPGIVVPIAAVRRHESVTSVFVVDRGFARSRLVRIGEDRGKQIEIIAGLEGGEQVIVSDVERLVDGIPVKTGQASPRAKRAEQ